MNIEVKKEFKKRLIDLDIFTQSDLAQRLNISNGYLSMLLSHDRKSPVFRELIARLVKMDPKELWQE